MLSVRCILMVLRLVFPQERGLIAVVNYMFVQYSYMLLIAFGCFVSGWNQLDHRIAGTSLLL